MSKRQTWVTRGFESFQRGQFGNSGQNMYVSRAGVLQRIHQFDLNRNGYMDLLICNSQNHWERPPAYVYSDVLGSPQCVELPSDGAIAGAVVDLNGNGYDDLVLAMRYNGTRTDLNAFIYYGGPDGLSEKRLAMIPAPAANAVAVGDFNGNGRVDLAFVSSGKLRVFYQTELGFERERFVDLEIEAKSLDARDLDGDGLADLYALGSDGMPRVYWGGPDGLAADQYSEVPVAAVSGGIGSERTEVGDQEDHLKDTEVLARIVDLSGNPFLCHATLRSPWTPAT